LEKAATEEIRAQVGKKESGGGLGVPPHNRQEGRKKTTRGGPKMVQNPNRRNSYEERKKP